MSFKNTLFIGAAMMGGIALCPVPYAVAADLPDQSQSAVDSAQPMRVDAQIKELHDKLGITASQEEKWGEVAEAMRDTAKEVRTKLTYRADRVKTTTLTAVDELRSYRDLQQVQYDGVKRLLEPFEKLYGSMPAAQQKTADEVFEHPREEAKATGATTRKHN